MSSLRSTLARLASEFAAGVLGSIRESSLEEIPRGLVTWPGADARSR